MDVGSTSAMGLAVGGCSVAAAGEVAGAGRPGRRRLARRRLLRGLLSLPLLLAAGCGPTLPPQAGPDRPRQLTVWTLDLAPRFAPYMGRVIEAWERRHPGVKVRWVDVPWSSVERKLLAAVFARTPPDLVNLNPPFAANLASKGGLLDLSTVLPADASAAYLPTAWQAGSQGGRQFAIPWYLTSRVTLANRRLLAQAGYTAPPQRWQEVPAYAEAVRRRTGRYALFVTVVPDDSAELLESMVQMGVELLDRRQRAAFNSPAGRRSFAFWTDLYRRGLLPREVVSQGYRRAIELYQAGDLAQVASGPDFLRNLQTNAPGIAAHTAPFPPLTGPAGQTNVAVMNLVVPSRSPMAAEAASFALFLTDGAQQLAFAREARVLPSARSALDQLGRELALPETAGSGGTAVERGQGRQERLVRQARSLAVASLASSRVLVPATPGVKRLQAIVYTQLQRAMLGQISSDDALAEAARQWDRYAAARWP
jgi:putative chitobiose transport system substrate-binding protein